MNIKKNKQLFLIAFGIVCGVFLTISVTTIYAQVVNNTINGCVRNQTGLLRIIEPNQNCLPNETPLSWNQQGPVGATGASGAGGGNLLGSYTTDQLIGFTSVNRIQYQNFSGANFTDSEIHDYVVYSDFSNTNFTNTIWRGYRQFSNFTNASFVNAQLLIEDQESNYTHANFLNTIFNDEGVASKFTKSNFTNAYFTNSDLNGVTFDNGTFTNTIWSNTTCPDGTNSDDNGNTCEGHLTP